MTLAEVTRVAQALSEEGCALTSYSALGLSLPADAARSMDEALAATEQYDDVQQSGRTGMLMYRETAPLQLARQLVEPAVRVLFQGQPDAVRQLGTYAVNHYETGDFFNPHQDHFDGTVVIATLDGIRDFDLYAPHPQDDVFVEVQRTHRLTAGTLIVLNGFRNLGHAARCVQGPSVSAVVDVPVALLP